MARRLREEEGFTLVEVMVVSVLMILVLGATLTTFTEFESVERANTLQNESADQSRRAMVVLSRELRNLASPTNDQPRAVERATGLDLIFLTVAPVRPAIPNANTRNIRRVRYCLGDSSGGKATLWSQTQTWTTAAPPGLTPTQTASCPSADAGWELVPGTAALSRALAENLVNRETGQPVFTANATDLDRVTSLRVGIDVDVNPGARPAAARLVSGVFLRNQNRPPVAAFTVTDTGTGHRVLLNASGAADPEGKPLSEYLWYADGITQPVASGVIAYWTVPGAPSSFPQSRTVTLRVRDPEGLSGEQTQTGIPVQ